MRDRPGTRRNHVGEREGRSHGEHAEHGKPEQRIDGEAGDQRRAADDEKRVDDVGGVGAALPLGGFEVEGSVALRHDGSSPWMAIIGPAASTPWRSDG